MNIISYAKRLTAKLELFSHLLPRKKPFIYVALGDSTVEGIGASSPELSYAGLVYQHLKTIQKHIQYHNLGMAFATTQDVIHLQLQKAIALQPNLITLSVGANDIKAKTSLKIFRYQLSSLFKALKQKTDAEIVINTIPDFSYTPVIPRYLRTLSKVLISRINKVIIDEAKKAKIIIVDIYHQGAKYKKDPSIVSEDGLHPSDFGYAIWADTVLDEIAHIIPH